MRRERRFALDGAAAFRQIGALSSFPLPMSDFHRGEVVLMSTPFREVEEASLAAMTPQERASFEAALKVEEDRLRAAERVYARSTARGSRTAPLPETDHAEGANSL